MAAFLRWASFVICFGVLAGLPQFKFPPPLQGQGGGEGLEELKLMRVLNGVKFLGDGIVNISGQIPADAQPDFLIQFVDDVKNYRAALDEFNNDLEEQQQEEQEEQEQEEQEEEEREEEELKEQEQEEEEEEEEEQEEQTQEEEEAEGTEEEEATTAPPAVEEAPLQGRRGPGPMTGITPDQLTRVLERFAGMVHRLGKNVENAQEHSPIPLDSLRTSIEALQAALEEVMSEAEQAAEETEEETEEEETNEEGAESTEQFTETTEQPTLATEAPEELTTEAASVEEEEQLTRQLRTLLRMLNRQH